MLNDRWRFYLSLPALSWFGLKTEISYIQAVAGFTGLGGRLQTEWVAAFTGIRTQ